MGRNGARGTAPPTYTPSFRKLRMESGKLKIWLITLEPAQTDIVVNKIGTSDYILGRERDRERKSERERERKRERERERGKREKREKGERDVGTL
jgi:hypothetical protein